MLDICTKLAQVKNRVATAEREFGLPAGQVKLLAVSKTKPITDILCAIDAGQKRFGESYVQEAVDKIHAIGRDDIEWHFIGPIQSNKTRLIAENFSWVHSVDRVKIAQRLNDQLPDGDETLSICLQVNISDEQSKAGVVLSQLPALIEAIIQMPKLTLRGLMTIPAKTNNENEQRESFRKLRETLTEMNIKFHLKMDTLSMGMSNDMEAAIAEHATIVRVGSDIFGTRG